jgi:hypothetical protein
MIIGACGYGATGSSVLTDLLSEYDGIQVFDSCEFILPYMIDGLQDLEYHLMTTHAKYSSGDYAIKRFRQALKMYEIPFINKPMKGREFCKIGEEYVNSLIQLQFKGIQTVDMYRGNLIRKMMAFGSKKIFLRWLDGIFRRPVYLWPARTLNFSISPDNFYTETRKYIDRILIAMGVDLTKPVCLDQPFSGDEPLLTMKFFNNPKAVVIDRDPRDLYIQEKYTKHPDGKFFPRTNVDDFILYYRKLRINKGKIKSNDVLEINFEDFIYEYEKSLKIVEQFLNLPSNSRKGTGFNPDHSKNNTQLIRKYPKERDAVLKIEHELPEFLFPYEKYPNVDTSGPSFSGAERSYIVD